MKELLSKEAIEYWNEKASEEMHFKALPKEEADKINKRLSPMPSEQVMEAFLKSIADRF